MQTYPLEEVIRAWSAPMDEKQAEDPEAVRRSFEISDQMLKLLAEGRPVSPAMLADRLGLPVEIIKPLFGQFKDTGNEFDQDGNLVGAALALIPTPTASV